MTSEETKDSLVGFLAAVFNCNDLEYLEAVVSAMASRWVITDHPHRQELTGTNG